MNLWGPRISEKAGQEKVTKTSSKETKEGEKQVSNQKRQEQSQLRFLMSKNRPLRLNELSTRENRTNEIEISVRPCKSTQRRFLGEPSCDIAFTE